MFIEQVGAFRFILHICFLWANY